MVGLEDWVKALIGPAHSIAVGPIAADVVTAPMMVAMEAAALKVAAVAPIVAAAALG